MNGKVLVAGVGNIFLGDDAFGAEVISRLQKQSLPEHVTVADFGIRSYDLAYALMENWDLVVLVDALPQGGAPGTLYIFEPELSGESEPNAAMDAHSMNPVSVLQLVRALGGKPGRILVVGCEPATVEPNSDGDIALSKALSASVHEAVRMVQELIASVRTHARAA